MYDIKAAVHNHGPDNAYLYPTAEASLKRIAGRDKRIGVCLDVGHNMRAGADPVEFIRKHGDRIYEVHIKNIKIDPVKNFAKEGPRGELDIPGIFKAMNRYGVGQESGGKSDYKALAEAGNVGDQCIGCKACEGICPQHIEISQWMPKIHKVLG